MGDDDDMRGTIIAMGGCCFLLLVILGVGVFVATRNQQPPQNPQMPQQQPAQQQEQQKPMEKIDAPKGNLSEGIDAPEEEIEEEDEEEKEEDEEEEEKEDEDEEKPLRKVEDIMGLGKTYSYFICLVPVSLFLGFCFGPHTFLCDSNLMEWMPLFNLGATGVYFFVLTWVAKWQGYFVWVV